MQFLSALAPSAINAGAGAWNPRRARTTQHAMNRAARECPGGRRVAPPYHFRAFIAAASAKRSPKSVGINLSRRSGLRIVFLESV